jgi:hypothetical protein
MNVRLLPLQVCIKHFSLLNFRFKEKFIMARTILTALLKGLE